MARRYNFDVNKDYYSILNVSNNVTLQELYNLMDADGSNFTDEQNEAYAILTDSRQRSNYDKARSGRSNSNSRRQRVVNTQNGIQQANNGRGIVKAVAISALVVAILSTSVVGAMHADKYNLFTGGKGKNADVFDDPYVGDQYEESIDGDTELNTKSNPELDSEEDSELINGLIKNFGDATNQQDLDVRVDGIQEQLLSLGVFNIQTGQPYSDKEIEDIIKYINGAYLPEKEADAYTMVDTFLNFVCAEISSMRNLNMVQYQANSDVVTKDIVENDIATCDSFDYSSLLMGDSYCYPVVEHFQKYLDALLSTTDRDEYKKIHNQAYQDLADFMFGDGLVIGETRYNIKQLEGLQNQNDAAVFWMQIMKLEIFSVEGIEEEFTVSYSQAGDVIVPIEKIKEQFNVLCMVDEFQITDEGYVGIPVESNFATNIEVLMINSALGNGYLNNTDMYDNNYQYTKKNN